MLQSDLNSDGIPRIHSSNSSGLALPDNIRLNLSIGLVYFGAKTPTLICRD
jgi:hypothetical protein